jgi:hypothetical protein
MAGLAGLAAGLAQGYASGLKLRSELDDAEERRKLTAAQTEIAQGQAAKMKSEQEYEKDRKDFINRFMNPTTGEAVDAAPADGSAPQAGIKAPGNMFDQMPNLNDLGTLQRLNSGLLAIDAKHGKVGAKDLLEGAQRYRQMQQEGVIDAWNLVAAGDHEGAIKLFNSTGRAKLPEGTRFEARQEDDGFGTGRKVTNYYAVSPDGRTVNYRDMMRGTIAPAELMKIDSQTGYQIADLALKRTAEENLARHRDDMYKLTDKKYDKLIEEQRAQTGIALRRLGLAEDDAKYQKTQGAFTGAFTELTNTVGVNKKFDPALAGEKERKEQAAKLLLASGAQSIFEMNYDLKKNAAGLTPQMALQALEAASNDPSIVKKADDGQHYITMGNKQIVVPSSLAPKPAPAPAAAPARAGLRTSADAAPAPEPSRPGIQFDPAKLPTNPRERSAYIRAETERQNTEALNSYKRQVEEALPSLDARTAFGLQNNPLFSQLPSDVKARIWSVVNGRQ